MEVKFKGTYYAVIDKKRGIKFPDEFVGELTEYCAVYGQNKSINIMPKKTISDSLELIKDKFDDDHRRMNLIREIASCVYIIELDAEGRYELPLPLMDHTGFKIGDTVSIAGKDDRIEITLK